MGGCHARRDYADLQAFQRAPMERRTPNAREAKRIEKLEAKMQVIGEAVDAALEAEDEDKADALQEEGERLGEQLQALEDGLRDYGPNVKAAAGAIVTIDRQGESVIHRGLLREAEAKALRTLEKLRRGFGLERTARTTMKAKRRTKPPRPRTCPTGWRSA